MRNILFILIIGCGLVPLEPLPPLGCKDLEPVCTCNETGTRCWWQWTCVSYY